MRLKLTGVCLIALGLGPLAAPAMADEVLGTRHGSTYVFAKQTLITGAEATISARCPTGTHVWGGGFGGDTMKVTANETVPYDGPDPDRLPDDGWRAHLKASAPDQGQVFAICRRTMPDYAVRHGVAFRHAGTASAKCPRGTDAVGGGGRTRSGQISSLFYSKTHDGTGGWRMRVATPAKTQLTARAICTTRRVRQVSGSLVVPPGEQATKQVGCPDGTSILGLQAYLKGPVGGFDLNRLAPFSAVGSVPSRAVAVTARDRRDQRRKVAIRGFCL